MTSRGHHRHQRGAVHLTFLAILLLGVVVIVFNRHRIEATLMRASQHMTTQIQRVSTKMIEKGSGMAAQILRGNFSLHDPNDVAVTPGLFDDVWGDEGGGDDMVLPPLIFSPLTSMSASPRIANYTCASESPRVACHPVIPRRQ